MANNQPFLTKIQFRENMGLLGLDTVFYLSDRIFDMLDDDRDGKVPKLIYTFDTRLDSRISQFTLIRLQMVIRGRKLQFLLN